MSDETEDPPTRLRVRPYTVVRGRTEAKIELSLETMIRTEGGADTAGAVAEAAAIMKLCGTPQSVAEISAKLGLPLQVAKVLVGDLVVEGKVATHHGSARSDGRPDLALLERVLDGLQSL
ncbi:MAG: DUF742 domain-containing protein [Actinomycetota bacterium]